MPEYLVTFETAVEADDPDEAADIARGIAPVVSVVELRPRS